MLDLLLPLSFLTLIVFFIVFECVLNCFGELAYFGDRQFYLDWWNSTTFEEFARKVRACERAPRSGPAGAHAVPWCARAPLLACVRSGTVPYTSSCAGAFRAVLARACARQRRK